MMENEKIVVADKVRDGAELAYKTNREYSNSLHYKLFYNNPDNPKIEFIKEKEIEEKIKRYIDSVEAQFYYNYSSRFQYQLNVIDNSYPSICDSHTVYPNYYSFFDRACGIRMQLNRILTFHDTNMWDIQKYANHITSGPTLDELANTHVLSNLNYYDNALQNQGFIAILNRYIEQNHNHYPEERELNLKEANIDNKFLAWTINCTLGVNNSNNTIETDLFRKYKLMLKDFNVQKEIRYSSSNPSSIYGDEALQRKMFLAMQGNNSLTIAGSYNGFFLKWIFYQYIYSHSWIDTISNYNTYTSEPLGLNINDPNLVTNNSDALIDQIRIAFITFGTFERVIKQKFVPVNLENAHLNPDVFRDYYPVIVSSESLRDFRFLILLMGICPCPLIRQSLNHIIGVNFGIHEPINRGDFMAQAHVLVPITNRIFLQGYKKILFVIQDLYEVTAIAQDHIANVGINLMDVNLLAYNDNELRLVGEDRNLYTLRDFDDVNHLPNLTYDIFIQAVNDVINIENYRAPYSLFPIACSLLSRLKMTYKDLRDNGPVDEDTLGTCIPIPMNQLFVPAKEVNNYAENDDNFKFNNMFTIEYMTYNQQLLLKANMIVQSQFDSYIFINNLNLYKTNLIYEQNKANYRLSIMLKNNNNMIGFHNLLEPDNNDNIYNNICKGFDEKIFSITKLFEKDGIFRYKLSRTNLNQQYFQRYHPILTPDSDIDHHDWYYYYATISDIVINLNKEEIDNKELCLPYISVLNSNLIKDNYNIQFQITSNFNEPLTFLNTKEFLSTPKDNENIKNLLCYIMSNTVNINNPSIIYKYKVVGSGVNIPGSPGSVVVPVYNISPSNCIYNSVCFASILTSGCWYRSNAKIINDCFKIRLIDYNKKLRVVVIKNRGVFINTRKILTQEFSSDKIIDINIVDLQDSTLQGTIDW